MIIRPYSDLHWEHTFNAQHRTRHANDPYPEFWVPPEQPDDKDSVLVLAGDLYNGLKSIPIIKRFNERFKAVLLVLGNHDFYNQNIHTLNQEYKDELIFQEMNNVHLLDRDVIKIDDVVFIGATLWTDMNKEDPYTMMVAPNYMTPDFSLIHEGKTTSDEYITRKKKFQVATWLDKNEKHFEFIKKLTESNADEKVCIVTHHGCTFEAVDEKFEHELVGNGFFFSEYGDYITDHPNIRAWIHGHTHSPVDLKIGECSVVANPFGYPGEKTNFNEYFTIEI